MCHDKTFNSNKPRIVECSSVYAIDYTAVLYSMISDKWSNYEIYLNDIAETKSNHRRYISRLAIPTFNWEIAPDGSLRQIHVPIEELNLNEFLRNVRLAIASYGFLDDKELQNRMRLIGVIEDNIKADRDSDSIDYYIVLIEQLIELFTDKRICVHKFSKMRNYGNIKLSKELLQIIHKEILTLKDGKYKFSKGGTIEILHGHNCNKIKNITKNIGVSYFDEEKNEYNIEDLINGNIIRFRGPLESMFLCCLGTLIDLPWYLDANLSSEEHEGSLGIEFISPVSVDSKNRTSTFMGGNGQRLRPSGYSLIEYKSENLIKSLKHLYPFDDNNISFSDLWDWENLLNNYPISHQKIAKSQSKVHQYCEKLINTRYKNIESGGERMKINYTNYILLGVCLVDITATVKQFRLFFSSKSLRPYPLSRPIIPLFKV